MPKPSHMTLPDARPVAQPCAVGLSLFYPIFIEQSLSNGVIPVLREKIGKMINHLLL
ncbi:MULTISPECIES: hypothetical protein [unclassified Rhizobium]|uniref:hypothetical protein n=1 Tax=unclassified Rhizobium TaxID=2613769 RepID=UPI0013DDE804|nr:MULTISPECIES: hypothetical protein [unclassified Rhizobium]